MSKEIELKFRLDKSQIPNVMSDAWLSSFFISDFTELRMESTYFDTPARDLSDARITFRMRKENENTRFTIKTPRGEHERGEWEVSAETMEEALPALLALGAPTLPPPPYLPCAFARFLRRMTRVSLSEQTEFELCIDVGTLGTLPFCELELELKRGTKAELEAFGALLATRFSLVPESRSKFARAKLSQ